MKHLFYIFLTAFALLLTSTTNAQDGKTIFESYCSACHKIDKRATGPALQGSRQRWIENSTEENLYKWIKNSQEVIKEGDPYAVKLFKEYNESIMTPQALNDEQITAVLEYVDNPPVEKVQITPVASRTPVVVENQAENKKIFWWLVVFTVFLLVGILAMSSTLKSLLKSEAFKKRYKPSNDDIIKAIIILLGFTFLPQVSQAMTISFEPDADGNFFTVSRTDLWMLLTLDIVLLGIFFYMKSMVNSILRGMMSKNRKAKIEKVAETTSVTKILIDAVPVEEEESIMMDHEYDGIRELDNNLPPWWKWGFYLTIAFAVFYLPYYHLFNTDGLQIAEYEAEMAAAELMMKDNVSEKTAVLLTEPTDLANGEKVYMKLCAVCHGQEGEGLVGPNLTDDHWLYEGDIKGVFSTIKYGTNKGMQSWSSQIPPREIQQVASYVLSLPYKEGKEPEGEKKVYESQAEEEK